MNAAEHFVTARKVFVDDNIIENTELCPHCKSMGQTSKLRYFFLNLYEAVYKCSNTACLYPFRNFTFKNFKDKTVYYYEQIQDVADDSMDFATLKQLPLPINPLSTKTFCKSQANADIEEFDFDFPSNFFDDIGPLRTHTNNQHETANNVGAIDELTVMDVDGIDEMLNGLIDDFGVVDTKNVLQPSINKAIQHQNPECSKPVSATVSNIYPSANTENALPLMLNTVPKTQMPQPKLSKCIKHIEKVKSKLNSVDANKKTSKPSAGSLPTFKSLIKTQVAPIAKPASVSEQISAIIQSQNTLRPLALLKQIESLDLSQSRSSLITNLRQLKSENRSSRDDVDLVDGKLMNVNFEIETNQEESVGELSYGPSIVSANLNIVNSSLPSLFDEPNDLLNFDVAYDESILNAKIDAVEKFPGGELKVIEPIDGDMHNEMETSRPKNPRVYKRKSKVGNDNKIEVPNDKKQSTVQTEKSKVIRKKRIKTEINIDPMSSLPNLDVELEPIQNIESASGLNFLKNQICGIVAETCEGSKVEATQPADTIAKPKTQKKQIRYKTTPKTDRPNEPKKVKQPKAKLEKPKVDRKKQIKTEIDLNATALITKAEAHFPSCEQLCHSISPPQTIDMLNLDFESTAIENTAIDSVSLDQCFKTDMERKDNDDLRGIESTDNNEIKMQVEGLMSIGVAINESEQLNPKNPRIYNINLKADSANLAKLDETSNTVSQAAIKKPKISRKKKIKSENDRDLMEFAVKSEVLSSTQYFSHPMSSDGPPHDDLIKALPNFDVKSNPIENTASDPHLVAQPFKCEDEIEDGEAIKTIKNETMLPTPKLKRTYKRKLKADNANDLKPASLNKATQPKLKVRKRKMIEAVIDSLIGPATVVSTQCSEQLQISPSQNDTKYELSKPDFESELVSYQILKTVVEAIADDGARPIEPADEDIVPPNHKTKRVYQAEKTKVVGKKTGNQLSKVKGQSESLENADNTTKNLNWVNETLKYEEEFEDDESRIKNEEPMAIKIIDTEPLKQMIKRTYTKKPKPINTNALKAESTQKLKQPKVKAVKPKTVRRKNTKKSAQASKDPGQNLILFEIESHSLDRMSNNAVETDITQETLKKNTADELSSLSLPKYVDALKESSEIAFEDIEPSDLETEKNSQCIFVEVDDDDDEELQPTVLQTDNNETMPLSPKKKRAYNRKPKSTNITPKAFKNLKQAKTSAKKPHTVRKKNVKKEVESREKSKLSSKAFECQNAVHLMPIIVDNDPDISTTNDQFSFLSSTQHVDAINGLPGNDFVSDKYSILVSSPKKSNELFTIKVEDDELEADADTVIIETLPLQSKARQTYTRKSKAGNNKVVKAKTTAKKYNVGRKRKLTIKKPKTNLNSDKVNKNSEIQLQLLPPICVDDEDESTLIIDNYTLLQLSDSMDGTDESSLQFEHQTMCNITANISVNAAHKQQ